MSDNSVSRISGLLQKINLRVINQEFVVDGGDLIYQAKKGDTLQKILELAQRFSSIKKLTRTDNVTKKTDLTPEVLAEYNDLNLKPDDELREGQIVRFPLSKKQIDFETYMDGGDAAKLQVTRDGAPTADKILNEIKPKIEEVKQEIDLFERKKETDRLIEEIEKFIEGNQEKWKSINDFASLCEAQKPLTEKIARLEKLNVKVINADFMNSFLTDIIEGRRPAILNPSIICQMLEIIGNSNNASSIKVLTRLLNEVETHQRKPDTNFDGLGADEIRFREQKYSEFLKGLEADPVKIITILGQFNDPAAIEYLGQIAAGEMLKNSDIETKQWAVDVLADNFEKFKNQSALEKIYRAVERAKDLEVMIFGIGKLGEAGDNSSITFIEKFKSKLPTNASEALRETIKDALAKLKQRQKAHQL